MPPIDYSSARAEPRRVLDAALETEKGVRVHFADAGVRTNFRHQLYTIRKADREGAFAAYPTHGRVSPYDKLAIIFGEDEKGLYLEVASATKLGKGIMAITSLDTGKKIKV